MTMRALILRLMVCAGLLVAALPAMAQNSFDTPGGSRVDGKVDMCINAQGYAVPCAAGGGGSAAGSGAQPYNYTPLTPGQYGLGVVTSTALAVPTGALQAVVCAAGQTVNYTYDGTTTPTAAIGMPLAVGQCIQFSGAAVLANLRFIQTAATATLNVSYTK